MESTRQAKIARLLQKELSEIFRVQTARLGGVIVTVSSVKVSPDLSVAKVYLSVFPSSRSQEILENIKESARTVRYELAGKVRCPELAFYLDDSIDYLERIDQLLEKDRD